MPAALSKSKPASLPTVERPVTLVRRGDRVGFWAAALCAVHCALLPLAVSAVPAAGLGWIGNGDFDQVFVLFASLLGMTTVITGYRRHRVLRTVWLLLGGLLLLWVGAFTALHDHGWTHAGLMTLGGSLLALAHWWNLRISHRLHGVTVAAPSAR